MKKFLSIVALAMVAFVAGAQNFISQSFLSVSSVQVNSNTTSGSITNLGFVPGMLNLTNTAWTNLSGTLIVNTNATTTTNSVTAYNVFKDVSLWPDRDGRSLTTSILGTVPGSLSNYMAFSTFTVFMKIVGGANANSAVTIVFSPKWDGETYPLATSDDWSVAVTATTTTPVTLATNVPLWKWPGAKSLTVRYMSNADTDGASGVWIQKLSLNGFAP